MVDELSQDPFDKTANKIYSQFIHLSRYSLFREQKGRREQWSETVLDRWRNFWYGELERRGCDMALVEPKLDALANIVYELDVMPSMRSLMTAGPALDRDHVAGYNCAYSAVDGKGKTISVNHEELDEPIQINISNPVDFDEIMYILLCGTGVGFSVERQYVNTLPKVGKKLNRRCYDRELEGNFPGVPANELSWLDSENNTIRVADSKYGWASALRILIVELYNGNFEIDYDLSEIRPEGSVLKTFGGRSSGPGPLQSLFDFTIKLFSKANGRRLTSLECHDLICKIASIVVVGGVRRSALISLSNPSDDRMRHAKSGAWWEDNVQRALANNSAIYTEKPDLDKFMDEMKALYDSKSGERGIMSRPALQKKAEQTERRDSNHDFGTNPCSEIILRSKQFCNLTEVVVRPEDTVEDLKCKVQQATVIGTFQSMLTDFKYLRPEWQQNCEEERLLGVSLTGIMDHPILNDPDSDILPALLDHLRECAVETNKAWADYLGINQSTAVTCVKPSGTVSQLVDAASGIHPRFSPYYIRTVRADHKDPVANFMSDKGFYWEWDQMNPNNMVFYFPMKSPEGAVCADDYGAIQQLRLWMIYNRHWCEHKPSCTVYYRDEEFLALQDFVYKNFDEISGISFLPYMDHNYPQAPYQAISEQEYYDWLSTMPEGVDWTELVKYESEDNTEAAQELACKGGSCEL